MTHHYTIAETLSSRAGTVVYRAVRDSDHVPVVLKLLDPRQRGPKDLERLRREYEIGHGLNLRAALRPIELETYEGMPGLAMEDFGGLPLDRLIGTPMEIGRFIELAIRIAGAVEEIHRRGVVHGDLKPENILVHPVTGEVKIADFGLAFELPREIAPARPPQLIEGSLPYLSPEQTGRVNRAVDTRSDLYSLGVTFYQMLTGRLPFGASDPLEWIYCHIARVPPPPSEIVPTIPQAIERIVQKLLAKPAEDRYQTARGLVYDLQRCAASHTCRGSIEPFPLAERDVPDYLRVSQKLYGRENEIRELLGGFERVVTTGKPELLLISGYSGIGKSSLAQELRRPVVRARGHFLSGKFDQYARNIPYSTVVQAFTQQVLGLLADGQKAQQQAKEQLSRALGPDAQLIVDVIPALKLLLGEQPPATQLPLVDEERRFRRVFVDFIRVFASKARPLVLFLDDLQWADRASLQLLEEIVTDPETRWMLFVGAYRDAEVTESHPLASTLERIRKTSVAVRQIVLSPLRLEPLVAMVADTVRATPERARPLATVLYEKTGGNPFFALQFLSALRDEGILRLDEASLTWLWDVARIEEKGYTDNVVDFMVRRLSAFSRVTQDVLQIAACVGSEGSWSVLALAHGTSEQQARADLWDAIGEGLIVCSPDGYAFAHDRVRQAAYSLIPEQRRAKLHLAIGRLLFARTSPERLEDQLFDVVTQLDLGAMLIDSAEERLTVAELNLRAGRKARAATAYSSAVGYLSAGQALLPGDCWEVMYGLTYSLHVERARCEWLSGNVGVANDVIEALLSHAKDHVDQAEVYRLKIEIDATHREIGEGVRTIRAAASKLFHIDLPSCPTEAMRREAFESTWRELAGRPIEELVHLPGVIDPDTRAEAAFLSTALASLHLGGYPALFDLMCCELVKLSIRGGNSEFSPMGYALFGAALGRLFERWDDARRFGEVARKIIDGGGPSMAQWAARSYFAAADFLDFWVHPVGEIIPLAKESFELAVKHGDVRCACWAGQLLLECRWIAGEPLAEVASEAERRIDFARRARYHAIYEPILNICDVIRRLRGSPLDSAGDVGTTREEDESESGLDVQPFEPFFRFRAKAMVDFLFGHYESAVAAARKAEKFARVLPGHAFAADCDYFIALTLAAHYDDAPEEKRRGIVDALLEHQKQHRIWQKHCPETFLNRYALVSAELARIEGRADEAMHLYEHALESARQNGFVHNEAIACECAARFYHSRGLETLADAYLRQARSCYVRWGADATVKQLDELRPWLCDRAALTPAATLAARSEQIDLLSVVKASQSISSQIVHEDLVRTLLEVVLEQSGAQRAVLCLYRDESLFVEARAEVEHGVVVKSTLQSMPVEASALLPISLLRYVALTREATILDEVAAEEGRFAGDAYLARAKPKSALCLPILRQTKVVGLLYLENRLLAGVFTPERLTALQLLATQSAISVDNAQLLAAERATRAAAEAAKQRAALLAEAGVRLSESVDYEKRLKSLTRLCVGTLADWCVIDVVEGDKIRRAAGAHVDPGKQGALEELQRRYPPGPSSPHPMATVLRTGVPRLLREISDEMLRELTVDEGHARLLRELGLRSAVIVPMLARGQTIGCLSLGSARSGRYDEADLELVQDLAGRAAIAIDNARLYRASQEAVQIRDEFLSIASHELYTPMTSLRLVLQALERLPPGPVNRAMLDRFVAAASAQGDRLKKLVGELLDAINIERGSLSLDLSQADLKDIVREVVERFEPNLAKAHCDVSVRNGGPVVGLWDRSRLDQVVTNLLSNAMKFGAGHPIEIVVGRRDGFARLAVTDHGIGIDPARIARIFERFERAVSAQNYGGLGLGLRISQRIVEAHGGSIAVQSQPGAGATFAVELPCLSSSDANGS